MARTSDRRKLRAVRNAFCPTGPGGGQDNSCSPYQSVGETHFEGLHQSEKSAIMSAVSKALKVGDKELVLRSIKVRDDPRMEGMGFGYSNGHVSIAKESIEAARNHSREKALARYAGEDAGKRSFTLEDARSPEEYLAMGVAHEIGHHAETALLLDTGKAAREVGVPPPHDVEKVSGYATTHPVELFAETHALVSTGRQSQVPDSVMRWYRASLATADPEPIAAFVKNSAKLSPRAKRKLTRNAARKRQVPPGRLDPTGTSPLVKIAAARLRQRYAALKGDVYALVVGDDAFGLTQNVFCPTGEGGGVDPTQNAWCPTGPGGGQDNSCSAYGVTAASIESMANLSKEALQEDPLPLMAYKDNLGHKDVIAYWSDVDQKLFVGDSYFEHSKDDRIDIVAHEIGHGLVSKFSKNPELAQSVFFPLIETGVLGKWSDEKNRFVGFSGQRNPDEALADLAKDYLLRPDILARHRPKQYEAIRSLLNKGTNNGAGVQLGNWKMGVLFNSKSGAGGSCGARPVARRLEHLEVSSEISSDRDEALFDVRGLDGSQVGNARFEFASSPKKLEKFAEWLRGRIGTRLHAKTDEELWSKYAADGYARGAGQAFDNVHKARRFEPGKGDFYAGSRQQFLRDAFGRPERVEKVKLLASRTFLDLKNVDEDMATRMGRVLVDGLVTGRNPRQIAKLLDEEIDVGQRRAEVIARTEIIRAHAEGSLDAMEDMGVAEVGAKVEWSTAGDDRVCPLCDDLEGKVFPISKARGMLPRHPQCFPPGTLVLSRSGVSASSERLFDGFLVVVRTAHNRLVTCTPNHPILTDHGWVFAGNLNPTSRVVCDIGSKWELAINHDNENAPSLIEKVAKSLGGSREVAASKVPVTAPDFHGDGSQSKVAIIRTYGELGGHTDTSRDEQLVEPFLGGGSVNIGATLPSLSGKALLLESLWNPAAGIVSRLCLKCSLRFRHTRPLHGLSFTLPPSRNSRNLQNSGHGATGLTEPKSDNILRVAPEVSFNHFVDRQVRRASDRAVVPSENSLDNFVSDSKLSRDLATGQACPVEFDQVVSVRFKRYVGHVYNLQTGEGWYSANGIITHNCRCAWLPVVPDFGKGK